ncbi:MAG: aminopeptidase P N-terminal domain-containing protein [Planctomycetota bacterium]
MSQPFATHREQLLASLAASDACGVYFSGSEKLRNGDSTFRFRPESDFYYLTGCDEPDSCLVLSPHGDDRAVLFVRPKDREAEIWNGKRVGVDAAPEVFGVDRAYPIAELEARLPGLLVGHRAVEYGFGVDDARDRDMTSAAAAARRKGRAAGFVPEGWLHPRQNVHEQRLRKTPEEIERMRRAAAITAEAHLAVMAEAAPGGNEAELDALLEYTFRRRGGTGAAYTNIVAGGAGACILHYIENNRELKARELLLIDAGAEWDFYASDVTRTFPIDGSFTPEQRALYEVVLTAQESAIDHIRPGVSFDSVHDVAVRRLTEGLVELGLIEGPVDRAIEEEAYRPYYMHRTGHWLGLDVHDAGAYTESGASRALAPGMVLTVEPGLYVAEDAEVDARWRGIGIRIEDDVLVTESGFDVLTAATPKSIEAVEAACQGAPALAR